MKKNFKKILHPVQSFESWATEHSVSLNKSRFNIPKRYFARLAVSCCALVLIMISLVSVFNSQSITLPKDDLKTYSTTDVFQTVIELEELYNLPDLILFNRDNLFSHQNATIDKATENENLILSYNIFSALIVIEDSAFFVNYIARTYPKYDFYGVLNFTDLQPLTTKGHTSIAFKQRPDSCLLSFSENRIDYFLTVTNFNEGLPLNETDLLLLIDSLFGKT